MDLELEAQVPTDLATTLAGAPGPDVIRQRGSDEVPVTVTSPAVKIGPWLHRSPNCLALPSDRTVRSAFVVSDRRATRSSAGHPLIPVNP